MDELDHEENHSYPEVSPPEDVEETSPKPALVINFYSWATPVAAAVMLVVGLLLGYFGRPLLPASSGSSAQPTQDPKAASGGSTTPTADIMAYLVNQTHHFKGNQNAPVTIIEFSDYQ